MNLSRLFSDNYDYLNTVAKRITRSKSVRMAPELLSTTYLIVHEKHQKGMFVPEKNEEFVKWFSKCMSNYFTWPNSEFNKIYSPKEMLCNPMEGIQIVRYVDEDAARNIEIQVEETNDITRELIEISSNLGSAKTLKYIEVIEFKRSLPPHETILFELYFEKGLSTRKIAKQYSDEANVMNYQSVNHMVNSIKSKIKVYQWRQ